MAILNVNNPGDVVLDQAPEPLPAPTNTPVADDIPGMPNQMKTIPVAASTAPPAAAPAPPPVAAPPAQPRFTKLDSSVPIKLDAPAPQAPLPTQPGIQKLAPNTQLKLDLPKSNETYLQATGDALIRGAVQSGTDVAHAAAPFTDRPQPKGPTDAVDQVINGPIWRGDLKDTIGGLAVKTAHNIGANAPSLGLGIAGAAAGGAVGGPVGATVGGAAGFGSGSALQEIEPAYVRARQDGLTHDQAVDRAIHETLVSGGFGIIAGLAPEVKFFGKSWQLSGVGSDGIAEMVKQARKPISEALAQVFAVQPGIGAAQQEVDAKIENKPLTAADIASGYVNNAATGAALSGLHGVKNMVFPVTEQVGQTTAAPGSREGVKPQHPPIYDADVVQSPKKISPPDDNGQTTQDLGGNGPAPAAPGAPAYGAPLVDLMQRPQVDVPLNRDDLAAAINNGTPLPTKKTISLPDVHIDPELKAQGYFVGNKVQQITDDGEVHEGTVASAVKGDDGQPEVTILDHIGNLRTLFATDGHIQAAPVPPTVSNTPTAVPAAANPPATPAAAATPAPPPAPPAPQKPESLYSQMDMAALKNSLDFVNNHGKTNGWNKSSTATKKAITAELNKRFPEWQVPARADLFAAAQDVAPAPTDAQKEAGNYQKGHVSIQGLPVTLETIKGQIRSGVGPDGQAWQVPMPAHYGYIKRTTGADDEHVDVYVGNHPDAKEVYVVDQINAHDRSWDEHKAMLGFSSPDEALHAYNAAFSDGKGINRIGGIKTMSIAQFKNWLKNGDTKKPLSFTPVDKPDMAFVSSNDEKRTARNGENPDVRDLAKHEGQVPQSKESVLPQLRGEGDQSVQGVAEQLSGVHNGHTGETQQATHTGPEGQQRTLRAGEHNLGDQEGAGQQHAEKPRTDLQGTNNDNGAVGGGDRSGPIDTSLPTSPRRDDGKGGADNGQEGRKTSDKPAPQPPPVAPPAPPTKLTRKQAAEQRKAMFDLYFKPGRIISGYGGIKDKVISYTYDPYRVTVEEVDNGKDTQPRTHSTLPDMREVKKVWAVEGPQAAPAQVDKPAEKPELPPADVSDTNVVETPKAEQNQPDNTTEGQVDLNVNQTPESKPEPAKKRLEDVGEKLEGGRKFKGQIDKIPASEQAKLIIDTTKPAVAFDYKVPEGQTSGVSRFHQELMSQLYNFSDYLYKKRILKKGKAGRYSSKMPSWQDQVKMLLSDKNDGTSDVSIGDSTYLGPILAHATKLDIINAAKDYIDFANKVNDIFEHSRNLTELRIEFKNALEDADFSSEMYKFSGLYGLGSSLSKEDKWNKFGSLTDETAEKAKAGPEKKLIRPRLERIERTDLPDYREGKDVTPQTFKDTFGFRGVEFGNWVNASEGQAHVNHAFDAFKDLAKRLGIRDKDISIGGKLGFAFGARGSGEHAAHYEPDTNIINLTKTKGDGSVAHEWSHALDHNMRAVGKAERAFMDAAYNTLSRKYNSPEEIERKVKQFLKSAMWYENRKKDGPVANAKQYLRFLRNDPSRGTLKTQFQKEGDDLGKDYWGTQRELFARAWEAWIFDTLDGRSPYLVNPWVADGAVTKDTGYRGTIYPTGEERRRFNDMYDVLSKNIEFTDNGVMLKKDARLPAEADLDAMLKAADEIEGRLGQMMKEIEDGSVQQGEIPPSVSNSDGTGESQFIPPDDAGKNLEEEPDGSWGRSGDDVSGAIDASNGEAVDGRGAGKNGGDGNSVQRDDTVPSKSDIKDAPEQFQASGENHVISLGDLSETRSQRQKAEDNIKIIKLVKQLEGDGRAATPAEQVTLAKFTGWGSVKNAFPDGKGEIKNDWKGVADQVKEIMTDEEYRQARRTIQYAHYTSEIVTRSMWDALKKFGLKQANIFEPGMGIGNFVGTMPADMEMTYSGIEVDPMSARIATALYPRSGVRHADFIAAQYADGMFDAAIGNPPFSEMVVKGDKRYKGLSLHNYFFAKTLDMVADGGVIGFVTSRYTMDAMDPEARKALAEKADLVGAIRLPNTAFKTNAHTEVVTDIIFLRKRLKDEESNGVKWTDTKKITVGGGNAEYSVNEYFVKNPEMVLGDFTNKGTMYGPEGLTVEPTANHDLSKQIEEAIGRLPEGIVSQIERKSIAGIDMQPPEAKDGSYYIKDGALMQVENGIGQPAPMRGKTPGGLTREDAEKVKRLIPVRDALRTTMDAMVSRDDKAMKSAQKELRKSYDVFVKKYGPITKSEMKTRPPATSQLEEARDEIRNDYMAAGEDFNEGDIDLTHMLGKTNPATGKRYTAAQIAQERSQRIAEIEKKGGVVDHGDFDPASVPDNISILYPNMDAFKSDPEYYNFLILENYDPDTDKAATTEVFDKNIVREMVKPEIKTSVDALNYSLALNNRVDIDFMSKESGINRDDVIRELQELDLIYTIPTMEGDMHVYAEGYLSGLVRDKLAYAKRLAGQDPKYQRNVNALEAVQPRDIPASDINTQLGSPYFSPKVIQDFMEKELNIRAKVGYVPLINGWDVNAYDKTAAENSSVHGTPKRAADELMSHLLMRKEIRITKKVNTEHGEKNVVDIEATQAAQDKAKALQDKFSEWIWKSEHGPAVHAKYNAGYNNIVPRQFDGKHITLASSIPFRPHQKTAVWRVLQTGNTYLAHAVGAGKTLEMAGTAMEMRRLGQWKKPLIVVPNHMLAQFAGEFRAAYPQAKIFVADERNFHTDRRQRFVANVAKGDWDSVVMTYSAFKKVPVSKAFEAEMIQTEVDKFRLALEEANRSKVGRSGTAARLEKQIEKMESRLKGLKVQDTDQGFSFDQLGVDAIQLDEGHYFRKLSFATMQGNMKGVNPIGSKAAWDLYVKSKYLDTIHPGRNLVIASGTPLTNTLAEVYTIQRFMNEAALHARNISTFDAWSSVYAASVTNAERQPSGAYKNVTRLAEFRNLNSLSQMVREFMDVVTSDELGALVDRPTMKTGTMIIKTTPPTREYLAFQKYLADRTAEVAKSNKRNEKGADNILSIINEGRHAAIDMRLIDPTLPEGKSKLEDMIQNVFKVWKETAKDEFTTVYKGKDKAPIKGGAQLIFSDLGVRSRMKDGQSFSAYDHIRRKLIRMGIPQEQIAFISDYDTTEEKRRLQAMVRSGEVRILIGSTAKMGTGLNVQNRLKAVHNLDAPWLPADLEQRTGRALRQGNQYSEIENYGYGTEGSYDSTMWGMLETKAKAIIQFLKGDADLTTMRDIEETDHFRMAKAMTSGDTRVLKQAELESEVEKLGRQAKNFTNEQVQIKTNIARNQNRIETNKQLIEDIGVAEKKKIDFAADKFLMTVSGEPFDDRAKAAEALEKAVAGVVKDNTSTSADGVKVADYRGFEVKMFSSVGNAGTEYELFMPEPAFGDARANKLEWAKGEAFSGSGTITRLNNAINRMPKAKEDAQATISRSEREIKVLESQINGDFPKQEELRKKRQELVGVEKDLKENAPAEIIYDDYPLDYWRANKASISNSATDPSFKIIGNDEFTYGNDNSHGNEPAEKMQAAINGRLKALGWPEANFVIPADLNSKFGVSAEGAYWKGFIYASMKDGDILKTINHEVIHGLKDFGAFTAHEWSILSARAAEWRKKYDIDARYMQLIDNRDFTDPARRNAVLDEEAIAHAFQDYKIKGPMRRTFNKAVRFIKTIGNMLRGEPYNFTTAEDVFDRVASGEVSSRPAAQEGFKKAQGTKPEPESTDNEDFPMFSLKKSPKEALDEAGEALSRVRGLDRTFLSDLKRVSSSVLHPHQIASLYKEFTPVYRAVVDRFKQREVLIHQLSKHIDLYNRLDDDAKKSVDAALEIGRLTGETFKPGDDGSITVKNNGLENTVKSKDGDSITLTPVEAQAYTGVRKMLDTALDKYKETILEEAGLLDKGVKNAQDVEKLRAEAIQNSDIDQVRRLKNVLQKLNDVDSAKKKGYVPFKRWGEVGISVKNADGDLVHFERVEVSNSDRRKGFIGQSKSVQAAVERLAKKYSHDEYEINTFEMSKFDEVAANIDLRNLDILAASSEMEPSEYERLREMLERELQKKGFRSHFFKAKDVPGYSDDFERAINDYVVTISSYISRRLNNAKIEAAVAQISETGKSKLHQYARNYVDYVNKPDEELATMRMIGFTWYLAGNVSSGIVHAAHPLIVTAPWFKGSFKHTEIGKEMTKAYADVLKMINLKKPTDPVNFDKAPADVRDALIKALNQGDFIDMTANDAMAISSTSQALRGVGMVKRKIANALGMTIAVPEKINKLMTFIAAYRLAMKPGAQQKIRDFIHKDELGRAALAGRKSPEEFAFAYAQLATASTQYRLGKLNRPQIARGFGSLVFQFQSVIFQVMETMYKMGKVHGGKNYQALGAVILGIIALCGVKGLPFEENFQKLIEALYKLMSKQDLDIDTDVRETIIKYTHSPVLAEAILKGLPAALLNTDISGRVGFGNIAPNPDKISLGPWLDILYHNPMQAAKDASNGDYLKAIADISPNLLKNPLTGYLWGTDGVRTQSGQKIIDSSNVSGSDVALKALGIMPASISTKRDQIYAAERANTAVNDLRNSYTNKIARLIVANGKLYDAKGNLLPGATQKQSDQISTQINATFDEISHHNATVPLYQMVIPNRAAIKTQVQKEMEGADAMKPKKMDRERDQEIKQIYKK